MIAEVIVDIAHSEVDKVFEYSCEDNLTAGSRVKVPFGNRLIDGFVMRVKSVSEYPQAKLKGVASVFDETPALNGECLSLVAKIAERYHVPYALALRLFLPAEMRTGKVREQFIKYVVPTGLDKDAALEGIAKRASVKRAALEKLFESGKCNYTELCNAYNSASVNALIKEGLAVIVKERRNRQPLSLLTVQQDEKVLTLAQRDALNGIDGSDKTVQLIHGVTGSGKTEIYLSLISEQLKKGKGAIFLVPEISLTPQMLAQLRARFSTSCAIMHSGLSAGERFDEWWRLRSGEAKIAIGARSAIFAPIENVGVIIVDEEHDGSYSSETNPRYNALEIAALRAELNGCKLVLGSATPSVESFVKAKDGEYNLITLNERINKSPMPEIIIADMRKEVRRGNNTIFSSYLKEELEDCLKKGEQAIIFINRRGYSQCVICQECGYVAKCEDCDVTVNYHSDEDCLKCHYCGKKYYMLSACPNCGGVHIRYTGTGTQRVVAELEKLYPSARILRMDNDNTSGKDGHYKILNLFSEKKADVLVGTQMIAKGHDFPSVTLVGILDADMSLHFADYRSSERTFQLITQVAGRSGRASSEGKVVLQTYSPENIILRYAANYDYEGFFEHEISIRKATAYPPYATIVRVMVTGEDNDATLEAFKRVAAELQVIYEQNKQDFFYFNKMKAPILRLQNKFRYQVLMRLNSQSALNMIYESCLKFKTKNVLVYVEENPSNLS